MGRYWLILHRWAGLALGLFLAIQGLLGAWLVVAEPLDRWLHPELLQSGAPADGNREPIGLASAHRRVTEAFPERPIRLLMAPDGPRGVYRAVLDGEHGPRVHVDAHSGAILGLRPAFATLEEPVRVLHTGEIGGSWLNTAVGVLALALLVLTLSGLWIWWPGLRKLRRALRFSTASPAAIARDGHRWAGLAGSVLLGIIAVSGVYLVFHHAVQDTVNAVTGEPAFPPPLDRKGINRPQGSPDVPALVSAAREAVPEGRITLLGFPEKAGRPVQARLRYPGEWHPLGNSTVLLDPATAEVLAAYDLAEAGAGHYTLDHLYPLHIGAYGGTATRALHFIAALLPAGLFGTGLYLWARRRGGRRRRAGRQ